ncbi:hypothetical protein CBR_g48795 [Chara braunii]|uniref:F-box domain-containing protein n=1 Tax=Chara braunii TaxID=69332 RepID=A0A388M3L7_CHABU|nr:hypothetical protein CBR_g48795 [Chara braunii]|eukprot:GBG89085.1 hypothetical protein CBR_g48795 [Chara braunii]
MTSSLQGGQLAPGSSSLASLSDLTPSGTKDEDGGLDRGGEEEAAEGGEGGGRGGEGVDCCVGVEEEIECAPKGVREDVGEECMATAAAGGGGGAMVGRGEGGDCATSTCPPAAPYSSRPSDVDPRASLGKLPTDILINILALLPFQDIVFSAALVCREWRKVAQSPRCWRHVDLTSFCQATVPHRGTTYPGNLFRLQFSCVQIKGRVADEAVERSVRLSQGQLQVLRAEFCTARAIEVIASACPSLVRLELRELVGEIPIDEAVIQLAARCPQLSWLVLRPFHQTPVWRIMDGCPASLTHVGLGALANNCPLLTHLDVAGYVELAHGSLVYPPDGKMFDRLTYLNVTGCQHLQDEAIIHVANHCGPTLTRLEVVGCRLLTDRSLIAIALACPDLDYIDATLCTMITDGCLLVLARHCKRLTYLGMALCDVTDLGVSKIAFSCRDLRSVNLSWTRVTDVSIIKLLRHCVKLRQLLLSHCKGITSGAFHALLDPFPSSSSSTSSPSSPSPSSSVTWLKLSDCKGLSDSALTALGKGCPALKSLSLANCPGITDSGIAALVKGCPALTYLSLANCDQITDASVILIRDSCRGLQTLNLRGCKKVSPEYRSDSGFASSSTESTAATSSRPSTPAFFGHSSQTLRSP